MLRIASRGLFARVPFRGAALLRSEDVFQEREKAGENLAIRKHEEEQRRKYAEKVAQQQQQQQQAQPVKPREEEHDVERQERAEKPKYSKPYQSQYQNQNQNSGKYASSDDLAELRRELIGKIRVLEDEVSSLTRKVSKR
eukprot:TRINITY_DN16_c0_g5_i1.p1 TRINITY_DN16_c0_g5~~TRINITY_DN16_c0_g5_i1.p1  ORF type:complete len:140 (-),score=62.19 TRINITY_DN16_c0_g5_i1:136-555(-)